MRSSNLSYQVFPLQSNVRTTDPGKERSGRNAPTWITVLKHYCSDVFVTNANGGIKRRGERKTTDSVYLG